MKGMASYMLHSGFGEREITRTHEVTFGPSNVVAQASIYEQYGDTYHCAGISAYRTRPTPDGPEKVYGGSKDYERWWATIYVEKMSSVTFILDAGSGGESYNEVRTLCNLFYW